MKKRILALFLACLMLAAFAACKRKNEEGPTTDGELNTPESAGDDGSEEDVFYATHGYTADYAVTFTAGTEGIDTAKGELTHEGAVYAYDFTAKLSAIYYDIGERNFRQLPEDLTYRTLTGNDPPEGTVVYTVAVTDSGNIYTVITDAEALTLTENSDVSNLKALIDELLAMASAYAADATPK